MPDKSNHPWLDTADRWLNTAAQWADTPVSYPVDLAKHVLQKGVEAVTTPKQRKQVADTADRVQKGWHGFVDKQPVVSRMALNLVPSAIAEGAHLIGGVGDAAVHPVETAYTLGKGALSGAAYAADKLGNLTTGSAVPYEMQRYLEAPARRMGTQLTSPLRDANGNMTLGSAKNAVINNPGGLAVDAAMLLAPAAEGAGLVGKGAGLAGRGADFVAQGAKVGSKAERLASNIRDAAEATSRKSATVRDALHTAAKATNPVSVVAKPLASVGQKLAGIPKLAKNNSIYRLGEPSEGMRGDLAKVADVPVNPTDELQGAVNPTGLNPSDRLAAHEGLRNSVENSVNAKGLSPAAIAEGEAKFHGVDLSREHLEGMAKNKGAANEEAKVASQKLADSSASVAPDDVDAVHESIGNDYVNAHRSSQVNSKAAYDALDNLEGSFGRGTFFDELGGNIDKALNQKGSSIEQIQASPSMKKTQKALGYVRDMRGLNGEMDMPTVNSMHKEMNDLLNKSKGTDRNVLGQIKEAVDKTADDLIESGEFTGDLGEASGAIKNAANLYKQHMATYGPKGRFAKVANALGDDGKGIFNKEKTPSPEQASKIGSTLIDTIANPKLTRLSADALTQIVAANPALGEAAADAVRWRIAHGLENGAAGADVLKSLEKFDDLHAPEERAHIASAADIHDLVNQSLAKPPIVSAGRLGAVGKEVLGTVAGGMAGTLLGPVGGTIGALTGDAMARAQARTSARADTARGAAPALNLPSSISQSAKNAAEKTAALVPVAPLIGQAVSSEEQAEEKHKPTTEEEARAQGFVPLDEYGKEAPETVLTPDEARKQGFIPADEYQPRFAGGRVGFATGGSTGNIEPLVGRLMAKAEQAKRVQAQATEPLLNEHDNAIAGALRIANGAI